VTSCEPTTTTTTTVPASQRLLTINTGSSSLKAAVYDVDDDGCHRQFAITAQRIGGSGSHLQIVDAAGATVVDQDGDLPTHDATIATVLRFVRDTEGGAGLAAVGHRLVHGGSQYSAPQRVTDDLLAALRGLIPIDPEHLPQALAAIDAVRRAYPSLAQIACFDTAFHRRMPQVAQRYPLPRALAAAGIVRYGFHGLSYEYIMDQLRALDPAAAEGRVVIAHLGNGASMAAVRGGRGLETTMGFTPTGGLMMGTRTGDLDPGVLLYLLEVMHMSAADVGTLVTQRSGLLGVSGSTGDMQELLAREPEDQEAATAVQLFCYQARKSLGALAAVLGGLETLVFTGGIGEHASPVRERICEGLDFLGVLVDRSQNTAHASVISAASNRVTVRVMQTDEDLMIARHTAQVIRDEGAPRVSV